jgi:hypothetical protein
LFVLIIEPALEGLGALAFAAVCVRYAPDWLLTLAIVFRDDHGHRQDCVAALEARRRKSRKR